MWLCVCDSFCLSQAPAAPKKKTGAAKPGGKGKAKGKDGWMEPSEPPEPAIAVSRSNIVSLRYMAYLYVYFNCQL